MEELDQEIEVLQGQTEEVPGPHREFSPERSDSYVEPSDIDLDQSSLDREDQEDPFCSSSESDEDM